MEEISNMLNSLNLVDKRHAKAQTLSPVMKRKLSVAIALVGGSKVQCNIVEMTSKVSFSIVGMPFYYMVTCSINNYMFQKHSFHILCIQTVMRPSIIARVLL